MPENIPVFDHFTPADWLLKNSNILSGKGPEIESTLNHAEGIFKVFNEILEKAVLQKKVA
jgi:hypothetical protein